MDNLDSQTKLSNAIDEYVIGRNAIRDREILKDNLIDGLSYIDLETKYNISQSSIKTILRKRKQQIFKHF